MIKKILNSYVLLIMFLPFNFCFPQQKQNIINGIEDTNSAKKYFTSLGYYQGYTWNTSINTIITNDSLESIGNQLITVSKGMKYLTLHFKSNLPHEGLNLADYQIKCRSNVIYNALGESFDAGQTFYKGELKIGTKFSLKPTSYTEQDEWFYRSSIFFEIPECSNTFLFIYKDQQLKIPQIILDVNKEAINEVNSWNDNYLFLVKDNDIIKNINEIKNRDVHIWWSGVDDANKVISFLNAIGKKGKINLLVENNWETLPELLTKKNVIIFMPTVAAKRLMEERDVKQIKFCNPTLK